MNQQTYDAIVKRTLAGGRDTEDTDLQDIRRDLQASEFSLAEIRKRFAQYEETIHLQRQLIEQQQRRIALLEKDRVLAVQLAHLGARR